jgi:hypothetical protein
MYTHMYLQYCTRGPPAYYRGSDHIKIVMWKNAARLQLVEAVRSPTNDLKDLPQAGEMSEPLAEIWKILSQKYDAGIRTLYVYIDRPTMVLIKGALTSSWSIKQ